MTSSEHSNKDLKERETDRQTETERQRQRQKQTHRDTDRHTDRDRETETHREGDREIQTGRQTDRQTDRQTETNKIQTTNKYVMPEIPPKVISEQEVQEFSDSWPTFYNRRREDEPNRKPIC